MPYGLIAFHKKVEYTQTNLWLEETTIWLPTPQWLSILKELIIPPYQHTTLNYNGKQMNSYSKIKVVMQLWIKQCNSAWTDQIIEDDIFLIHL